MLTGAGHVNDGGLRLCSLQPSPPAGRPARCWCAVQRGRRPPGVLPGVGPRQGAYRHSGVVDGRCLGLTGARAPKVDCPLLTRRRLKTCAEGAAAIARGDDDTAVARRSCDEMPPVFVHFQILAARQSGSAVAARRLQRALLAAFCTGGLPPRCGVSRSPRRASSQMSAATSCVSRVAWWNSGVDGVDLTRRPSASCRRSRLSRHVLGVQAVVFRAVAHGGGFQFLAPTVRLHGEFSLGLAPRIQRILDCFSTTEHERTRRHWANRA